MEIGIIGQGFVGSAIRAGLENYYRINTYDVKAELASCETLLGVVASSQIVFVCLPTPMNRDGSCDTSLVRSVISEVDQACFTSDLPGRTVVIKSTVPPGTTADLDAQCSNIGVIFSP
jgi:UDPglucose 6-dehydrogenase